VLSICFASLYTCLKSSVISKLNIDLYSFAWREIVFFICLSRDIKIIGSGSKPVLSSIFFFFLIIIFALGFGIRFFFFSVFS